MAPVLFTSTPAEEWPARRDLIAMCAGSGGLGAARRAAQYGARVAIIEETWRLGGICVNVGCVLKKICGMRPTWRTEKLHQANAYGFKVEDGAAKVDCPTLKEKRDKYIERLNGIYERIEGEVQLSLTIQ
ncbi:hypothetical protein JCM10207_007347 [Rhodosporidiobolus poonsookiae]